MMPSRMLWLFAVLIAGGAIPAAFAATAYVPNEGSATISVIDTTTDQVTSTIRYGKKPRGIAIAKDGSRLYLSDQTGNALVVVDLARGATIATVPLGDSPRTVSVASPGKGPRSSARQSPDCR